MVTDHWVMLTDVSTLTLESPKLLFPPLPPPFVYRRAVDMVSTNVPPLLPVHPPWVLPLPIIRIDLTQMPANSNLKYLLHIQKILKDYPEYKIFIADGSRHHDKILKTSSSIFMGGTSFLFTINLFLALTDLQTP